jgi:multidrug efflux pump subunit AcrA (membrane-fusion protein)
VSLPQVVLLLGLWLAWFLSARLPVYAVSQAAHLEVEHSAHPVVVPVGGQLLNIRAVVGQAVEAGDVLFELDHALERERIAEEAGRFSGLAWEMKSLRAVLVTERRGFVPARQANQAAIAEARAWRRPMRPPRWSRTRPSAARSDGLEEAISATSMRVASRPGHGASRSAAALRGPSSRTLRI